MEKLNKIQELASTDLKNNIVLNAGAGTGKTRVLTRRYINILKELSSRGPGAFDRILAITFTNKAAAEMKEKIKTELENSGDEELKNLSKYFSKANIYTIHGFCKKYISKNAMKYGISLDFDVADSQLTDSLLFDAIDDSLKLYENDQRLYDYLKVMDNYNFDSLRNTVFSLYKDIKNKSLELEDIKKRNQEFLNTFEKKDLKNLIQMLEDYNKLGAGKKFTNLYNSQAFKDFLEEENYDFLETISKNLGTVKREEVLELRSKIQEEISSILISFEIDNQDYYDLIVELLENTSRYYEAYKKKANVFDYSDLEDQALNILRQEENKQYKYILVDEFQDTNRIQTDILKYLTKDLSKDINLFVVGDPKQSIYGFRGGNIKSYKDFTKEMVDKAAIKLEMTENYRSSSKLISSFNDIFIDLLKEDYVNINANIAGEEKIKLLSYEIDQTIAIVNQIKTMLESGIDENDIAVLFRTNNEIADVKKELIRNGIRVNDSSNKFYDENEIKDLLIILKAIKNRKDIVNILAYFKSPYIGLDENSIFKLALYFKEKNDLDFQAAENLADEYKDLYLEGIEKLEIFRNYYKYYSLTDLIIKIIDQLNYYEISSIVNGENSLINIDILIKAAKEYEAMSLKNYMSFIEYVENLSIDEDTDKQGVNLMTIHKSKGLEFRVVIIANASGKSKTPPTGKIIIGDCGLGIDLKQASSKYGLIKEEGNQKDDEEELRLFYVAMTRAKEELILTVESKDGKEKISDKSYLKMLKDSGFTDYEVIEAKEEPSYKLEVFEIPNIEKADSYSKYRLIDDFKEQDQFIENKIRTNKFLKYYTATDFLSYLYDKDNFFKSHLLNYEDEIISENGLSDKIDYEIDPIVLGNIVHKYAEISPTDLESFIDSQFDLYGINKSEGRNLIKRHINVYDRISKGSILYRELEFFYKLDSSIIHGKIDQIRKIDDNYELVDIKTGRLNKEAIDLYKYQLHLYLIAIEKLKGIKIKRALLLSTLDEREYEIDISEDEVNKSLTKFKNFIKDIETYRK